MSTHEHKMSIRKSSVEIEETIQPPESNSILPSESIDQGNDLLDLEPASDSQIKEYGKFLEDRVVTIEGPELVTENVIKSYKLYKVKTRKRDQEEYDTVVSRRFSDFEYLQMELVQAYGGCIIPLLPEKNFWANLNMEGEREIERRVKGLEKYLRSLLLHEKIRICEELRQFLFGDKGKFFEKKGEYFSTIKTEETIKSFAQNAYTISKDFISNLIQKQTNKQSESQINLIKPSIDDIKIMEYQREVTDLLKVIDVLAKVVENSVVEMKCVGSLFGEEVDYHNILNEFEEISKYIFSCNAALTRRMEVRLEIDQLTIELEAWQKKSKTNPRSQELDILRSKLARANEKCEKWTVDLLGELVRSISTGKSMIEGFIEGYVATKGKFYDL